MKYLTLKSDVIIYTDSSKSAGVIDETKEQATGTILSAKFLKLIEQSLLSDSHQPVPEEAEKLVAQLAEALNIFELSDSSGQLGEKEESSIRAESSISINNVNVNEPSGRKITRKIGKHSLHYYITDLNIKGAVTTSASDLSAARLTQNGPQIIAESSGCGACGACGTCGACAVCAEINAYVGAVAVIAVSAAVALGESTQYAFDPAKRHEVRREKLSYDPEFTKQMEQLSGLLK